jgi:hypothetical protein
MSSAVTISAAATATNERLAAEEFDRLNLSIVE